MRRKEIAFAQFIWNCYEAQVEKKEEKILDKLEKEVIDRD